MTLFKVQANGDELMVEATKGQPTGRFFTRNNRARIGETVLVENGLGLSFTVVRIPQKKQTEMDSLQKLIGQALKEAREKRGFTQAELAAELGTTKDYISQVERGLQNLTVKQIERFLQAMGIRKTEIKFF